MVVVVVVVLVHLVLLVLLLVVVAVVVLKHVRDRCIPHTNIVCLKQSQS